MQRLQIEDHQLAQLHIHSEYSLMDGAIRIPELLDKVKASGHKAVAITDHGNLFTAIDFYTQAKKLGIKPIIGAEIYQLGANHTKKLFELCATKVKPPRAFHLVCLAKNNIGYQNLIKLVSDGYLNGLQEVPIVSANAIQSLGQEQFALSGCLLGEFGYLVQCLTEFSGSGKINLDHFNDISQQIYLALKDHVEFMHAAFGEGNYFIELINNNLAEQKRMLPDLALVAKHFGLPIVATSDAHYLNAEDAEAHTVLLAIKNELTLSKIRNRRQSTRFHLLSNEEMRTLYKAWPEALTNIASIVEQCNIELEFDKYYLPQFQSESGETAPEALIRLANEGLQERYKSLRNAYGPSFTKDQEELYQERLDYELSVIIKMNFPGYFLIVADFINWAKNRGIPVGPGRGSGAGSLVAYALRITDLDPIKYDLTFERFLNPERISMPDFDVDLCQDRRDEVIQYVTQKYGKDRVAQITTFGKMLAKAAVRDVGRALDMGYSKVDKIAKLIPNELGIKLQEAIDREPRLQQARETDPNTKDLLNLALKLEGITRHTSVHAAGVIISDSPLQERIPVYKTTDTDSLITQYEMKNAEKMGLVKFDFLGLKTLTVIKKTIDLIKQSKDPQFDIDLINLEDNEVYDLIATGHTVGVFQLEGSGIQQLITKLKPSKFDDVVALVGLYRPGPLGSGMVDEYVERKHGRQKIEYVLPVLEPILKSTYGIILYQDQVLQIAAKLANYSLGEADILRKAMGKKIPEEMAKQKSRFVKGCSQNHIKEYIASDLFDLMAKFAEYGFNKAHSTAYGLVSYQTAYLKTHYPEEFMAALMSCDLDNTDKIIRYIQECQRLRFKILPPDINSSVLEFNAVKEKTIGFGLAAIKGMGTSSLIPLIEDRQIHGPFRSLEDLAKRVSLKRVGKKTLELLIQVGAGDCFGESRETLFSRTNEVVKLSDSIHGAQQSGQRSLFDDNLIEAGTNEEKQQPALLQNKTIPSCYALRKEKKLLGVYLTAHPLEHFKEDIKRFGTTTIDQLEKFIGKTVKLVCIFTDHFHKITKTGRRLIIVRLEDLSGSQEGILIDELESADNLELESLVVAQCNVTSSFDGRGIRLSVKRLMPLETHRLSTIKKLMLTFNKSDEHSWRQNVHQLQVVCNEFKGSTPIMFKVSYKSVNLDVSPDNLNVTVSNEFIEKISQISLSSNLVQYII